MRRLLRFVASAASLVSTTLLVLMIGLVGLFASAPGRAFVDDQTEAALGRILGPDYSARLGQQRLDVDSAGNLALSWSDVTLMRRDAQEPLTQIREIKVGLRPLPLFAGRLSFATLEVTGARIDLTGGRVGRLRPARAAGPELAPKLAAEGTFLPALAERSIKGIEGQLAAVARIGIDEVRLNDVHLTAPIAADGGPFVAQVRRATLLLDDPKAMTLDTLLVVDKAEVPISATLDFETGPKRLETMTAMIGPVALGRLVPPTPREDRIATRPFASTSDARLRLAVRPDAGIRRIEAGLELGPGEIQAGRGHTDVEAAEIAVTFREDEDRIGINASRVAFDGYDMTLVGSVKPAYDAPGAGGFNGFTIALDSSDMRSTIGGATPVDGRMNARLRSDQAAKEVRLEAVDFDVGKGSLSGTGALRFGSPDARTQLKLVASGLSAREVKAFWPFNIAVGTRRWAMENLRGPGRVSQVDISLDVRHDRMDPAFRPGGRARPGELEVAVDFEGVAVKTLGDLPDVVDGAGRVEVHGADTRVEATAGRISGFDAVAVKDFAVTFTRAPDGLLQELDARLATTLDGPLPDLLALASRRPLNALRSLPFKAEDARGRASVAVNVELFLGDHVPKDRELAGWRVIASLADAGLATPFKGRMLEKLDGDIVIEPGIASGELSGRIDGIAAKVSFDQPFDAADTDRRRLEIAATLEGKDVERLGPGFSEAVGGTVAARLVQSGEERFRAEVDLTDASLTLPVVGWRKGKGIAAQLGFDLSFDDGGADLDHMTLKGEGFSATGEVDTDREGLRTATLSTLELNPGDDVSAKVERVQNGYSVTLKGKRFDARPLLADLRATVGKRTAEAGKPSKQQLDVSAAFDEVIGFGGQTLGDVSLNYAGSGAAVAALSIAGRTRKGGGFALDLSPRGEARAIELRAADAGALADFSGFYAHMEGGSVVLNLLGSSAEGYRGTLAAKDFTLVDEPRLSSLVGSPAAPESASLSQAVGRDLRTERAFFDHASAGIAFDRQGLRLEKGIIRGPVFGSSFAGTVYDSRNRIDIAGSFMPAYGLNRIFGAIPVVGQILGNGREGGLIGITYRLDGPLASPRLVVNPISAIAPGIFRNIFAYQ